MWQKPFVVHKAWKYFWHGLLLGSLQPLTVGLEYLSFYLPLALWIDGVQPQTTNSDISIFPAGAPTCGVYSLGLDLRRTNLHLLFAWCHRQLEKERCMGWLWTQRWLYWKAEGRVLGKRTSQIGTMSCGRMVILLSGYYEPWISVISVRIRHIFLLPTLCVCVCVKGFHCKKSYRITKWKFKDNRLTWWFITTLIQKA